MKTPETHTLRRERRFLGVLGGVLGGLACPFVFGFWVPPYAFTVPLLLGIGSALLLIAFVAPDRWVDRVFNALILWP